MLRSKGVDAQLGATVSSTTVSSCMGICWWGNPPDMDCLLTLAGLGDIVSSLHTHECVHSHAEGFLDTKSHIPGEVRVTVKQTG